MMMKIRKRKKEREKTSQLSPRCLLSSGEMREEFKTKKRGG